MAPTRYIFHYRFRVQYSSYLHTRREPQELRLEAEAEQNSTNKIFNVFRKYKNLQRKQFTTSVSLDINVCVGLFQFIRFFPFKFQTLNNSSDSNNVKTVWMYWENSSFQVLLKLTCSNWMFFDLFYESWCFERLLYAFCYQMLVWNANRDLRKRFLFKDYILNNNII